MSVAQPGQQLENGDDGEHEWLLERLHTLQAKVLTSHLPLPSVYKKRLETKYVKLLVENGINVNVQDKRDKRTALMYACIQESCTEEGLLILTAKNCNLMLQDRLGNTALMYAAMKGREGLTNKMAVLLAKGWGLSAIQLKNCMGHTAEDLALRNDQYRCARMVQTQRLHMVSCLNRQMDLAGQIGCRQWSAFATVLKCIEKWRPRPRRNSDECLHAAQHHDRKLSM